MGKIPSHLNGIKGLNIRKVASYLRTIISIQVEIVNEYRRKKGTYIHAPPGVATVIIRIVIKEYQN